MSGHALTPSPPLPWRCSQRLDPTQVQRVLALRDHVKALTSDLLEKHLETQMTLIPTGEERGRCFTIEYVMPMNTQLTSESTVNVLSRCLQLPSLGYWLVRKKQDRGEMQGA